VAKKKPTLEDLRPQIRERGKILTLYTHIYPAPFGDFYLAVTREGAVAAAGFTPLTFQQDSRYYILERNKYACGEVCYQLDQYFQGSREFFDLELALDRGTTFEHDVWLRLMRIEYGQTMSYSEIAQKVGRKGAARAVGNAVGKNPLPIFVPCHRVVPATGGLGHYSVQSLEKETGSKIKKYLLDLESRRTTTLG